MSTIAQILIEFHQKVIFFLNVQFLVGQPIIDDIISDSGFQLMVEVVILTNSVSILDILLKIVLCLSHEGEGVTDLINNVSGQHDAQDLNHHDD